MDVVHISGLESEILLRVKVLTMSLTHHVHTKLTVQIIRFTGLGQIL